MCYNRHVRGYVLGSIFIGITVLWGGESVRIWEVIVLGLLQGFTEFLPVSSSGHLVIAQDLLNISNPGVVLEIVLHLGTLFSVIIVFWTDIIGLLKGFVSLLLSPTGRRSMSRELVTYRKLVILLLVGIIPTAMFGLLLEPVFESLFSSVIAVGFALLLTGIVLFIISRLRPGQRDLSRATFTDALVIGLAQGCAIVPGLSRSGMTISSALARGLTRDAATRFSFLISIPTIAGAAVLKIGDIIHVSSGEEGSLLLLGFIMAALSGVLAIRLLVRLLKEGKLQVFAYYVWALGIFTIWRAWRV
ncbi:MAG TPA: undecaprenyl-diphosphatase [Firmicutes bacterium]|nr:undecaprenyl-diphosphatase [Bacillota bacterium]